MGQVKTLFTEDALLLQQMAGGSVPAFNALFEKYWGKVYADAYKRLKKSDVSKDIVQDIFTYIWIHRETIAIQNFPAYLFATTRNKVLTFIARQKPTGYFFDLPDNIAEADSYADSKLVSKEFFTAYESLLQSLPAKRQAIFRLHYQEDLSTKDISIQMGITRKTVQNQLGKAVDALKTSLARLLAIAFLF